MWKTILLPVLLAMLLSSCATDGPQTEPRVRVIDNSCVMFKPVYVSKGDILADATAKQILANNEAGAAHCGWKPAVQK